MKFIMIKTIRMKFISRIMIFKRKNLVKIKIKIDQFLKKENLLFHKKIKRMKLKTKR